jgi:hypothetical protein
MATLLPRSLWPADVLRWGARAGVDLASVPGRVLDLLTSAESAVTQARELIRRVDEVVTAASAAVAHAQRVTAAAEVQVVAAEPVLEFVKEFSAHELEAAIKLVDELPRLSIHLTNDVLPLLGTLDHVGPDIHELLAVVKDVRQAVLGIPGFEYLRRRGENKDDE